MVIAYLYRVVLALDDDTRSKISPLSVSSRGLRVANNTRLMGNNRFLIFSTNFHDFARLQLNAKSQLHHPSLAF